MDFLAISGCAQVYIIHKVAPRNYRYPDREFGICILT